MSLEIPVLYHEKKCINVDLRLGWRSCVPYIHPGTHADGDSGIMNMWLPRSPRALMSSRQVGEERSQRIMHKILQGELWKQHTSLCPVRWTEVARRARKSGH